MEDVCHYIFVIKYTTPRVNRMSGRNFGYNDVSIDLSFGTNGPLQCGMLIVREAAYIWGIRELPILSA